MSTSRFAIAVLFLLVPPTAWAGYVEHPAAIQTIYQDGVPQTDRHGVRLDHYDADKSFLPIGLYHAVHGDLHGRKYQFADYVKAGFNSAHLWEGQHLKDVADAAKDAGIQLIIHWPTDDEVKTYRDHPAVLGWYLDEEPIGQHWHVEGKPMEKFYEEFLHRRDAIHKLDATHPVFALDTAWIIPPATEWWTKWNSAGDVSAHDNYPLTPQRQNTISHAQGLPESIALAVKINDQKKPVWACLQAFEHYDNRFPFSMPTVGQFRAMTYAAFIHGATGVIDFALDSYVTRGGACVGIAPDPQISYGPAVWGATREQVRASRELWAAATALNAELRRLTPALLSPTAKVEYHVALDSAWPAITKEPIRTLLKTEPSGKLVLLVVNVDAAPQQVRVRFPGRGAVQPRDLLDDAAGTSLRFNGDAIEFTAGPWATIALEL
jgi:hypothetical protein